ncbi:MAG: glycosyltransferase [Verrucomicrobiales bacterium]|nr:glycosyltransferase [Verrucomicrobiales bacterium]
MKDLAVLIPSYNDTAALRRTLDSIEEENYSFTVFVVDDGSREAVVIPPGSYPFAVEVIRQTPNGGIVKALNLGLEHILARRFNCVARLDAADLNRRNRFSIQYRHLDQHPELAMVGSNVVFRSEKNGEPLFTTNLPLAPEETRRWIVFRNSFIHPAVMLRTAVLNDTGLYDASYPHIEDYVLFSRIVKNHRAANLHDPLVDCFVREGGISRSNQQKQLFSGLRFKLRHPRPLDPLWYAFLAKRTSFLILPHSFRDRLKRILGFTKPAPQRANANIPVSNQI